MLPDPRYDAIRCIVLAAMDDDEAAAAAAAVRVLLLADSAPAAHDALAGVQVAPGLKHPVPPLSVLLEAS